MVLVANGMDGWALRMPDILSRLRLTGLQGTRFRLGIPPLMNIPLLAYRSTISSLIAIQSSWVCSRVLGPWSAGTVCAIGVLVPCPMSAGTGPLKCWYFGEGSARQHGSL